MEFFVREQLPIRNQLVRVPSKTKTADSSLQRCIFESVECLKPTSRARQQHRNEQTFLGGIVALASFPDSPLGLESGNLLES